MSLEEVAAADLENARWAQYEATWGHLHPKPGRYEGVIVAARSEYNSLGVPVIHAWFEGVSDSPWFFEALRDYATLSLTKLRYRSVEKEGTRLEWGIFDGDMLLYTNSGFKTFGRKHDAEVKLRLTRERLAACAEASLSREQWGRAEIREISTEVKFTSLEGVYIRSPGVYEFRGHLCVGKHGHMYFVGRWTKMSLYPGRIPATRPRRPMPELAAAFMGKLKYSKVLVEGDHDYMKSNIDSVVRFLDTMNNRRKR